MTIGAIDGEKVKPPVSILPMLVDVSAADLKFFAMYRHSPRFD